MFFKILLFLLLLNFCDNYETKICGVDKNITLVESEDGAPNLIFIQSPGYPRSMTAEEIENCQFHFSKDSNDTALKFVITNGNVKNINTTGIVEYNTTNRYYYEAASNTTLTMYYNNNDNNSSPSTWHAFQGYVLSESMEICHCNTEPIKFENESQIIYLRPHNLQKSKFRCNWAYIGPKEYGFKFVIKEANKDLNLTVTTSSGYDVIKGYGIRQNQVYYNPDNFLNITVEGQDDFEAYVTFVKNHYNVSDCKCKISTSGKISIWSNIGDTAYPINAQCTNLLNFSSNSFVVLKINKFEAEPFVDYVEIIDAWDKKHYINHHNPTSWPLIYTPAFFPNPNKSQNSLTLQFISDGSVQNEGFEIIFESFECTCADSVITVPCNGEMSYSLLKQSSEFICPNTVCNFTITTDPLCPSKNLILILNGAVITEDKILGFKIFTDNETYMDSNDLTPLYHEILSIPFKPNSILNFFSVKNESYATAMPLSFILMVVDAPQIWQTIKLSEKKPSFETDLLKMPKNSILTVELERNLITKGDTIEMYTAQYIHLSCILLFNNQNLQRIEDSLLKMLESSNQISSTSSITIYKSLHCKDIHMPVFYRARNEHSKHCIFPENVFNSIPLNPVITEISKSFGVCEVVILSHKNYHIEQLWTTADGDNVINSSTSPPLQKHPQIYPFLKKFEIPPNSSIYIITSFRSKETITFYKIPTRILFDISTIACIRTINPDKDDDGKPCPKKFEIGFEGSPYLFEITKNVKRLKNIDDPYTLLQNAGFEIMFNKTHDKWGHIIPENLYNKNRL